MDRGNEPFDDRVATEPLSREAPGDSPGAITEEVYAPRRVGGAQYGGGRASAAAVRRPAETKPFFLTSEFLAVLLAIVAIVITAAVMPNVGAPIAWILIAAMVFGYIVSRGLAKAGSESHVLDPRERLLDRGDGGGGATRAPAHAGMARPGYGPWGVLGEYVGGRRRRQPIETTPFFLTSEFIGPLLAIVALAITAAVMPNVGARLAWILIAAMVFTYVLSRGLAKAGTQSHAFDPRDRLLGTDEGAASSSQGMVGSPSGRVRETKPFFLTSEFIGALLAILAVALTAAALASLGAPLAWILITAIVCAYVLSRGIAKIGVKSHALDPRERLLERFADSGGAREHRDTTSP